VHEGHVWFLNRAKALGDRLVVVVASDAHNTKPYARPASARAGAVRKLGLADRVVIGHSRSFLPTVLKVRPATIALGYDQVLPKDVSQKLDELKITVRRLPRHKGFSTRALYQRKWSARE